MLWGFFFLLLLHGGSLTPAPAHLSVHLVLTFGSKVACQSSLTLWSSFPFHPRECSLAHSSALQSEVSLDQAVFSPPSEHYSVALHIDSLCWCNTKPESCDTFVLQLSLVLGRCCTQRGVPLGPLPMFWHQGHRCMYVFGSVETGLGYIFSNINNKSLALENGLNLILFLNDQEHHTDLECHAVLAFYFLSHGHREQLSLL